MKGNLCDVRECGKIAYEQVSIRKNYWLGDKIIKIDVCLEHEKALLKVIGFESEFEAKRSYGNQWRNTKD